MLQPEIARGGLELGAFDQVYRRLRPAVHPRPTERKVGPGARRHPQHVIVERLHALQLCGADVDVIEAPEAHACSIPYLSPRPSPARTKRSLSGGRASTVRAVTAALSTYLLESALILVVVAGLAWFITFLARRAGVARGASSLELL